MTDNCWQFKLLLKIKEWIYERVTEKASAFQLIPCRGPTYKTFEFELK